jgi:hypothetical protein
MIRQQKNKQFSCFRGLLGSFCLPHEGKEAVAGWMLSEMLTEVPVHEAKPADALYVHS